MEGMYGIYKGIEVSKEEVLNNVYKTLLSPVWQMMKVDNCPHRKWNDLVICYRWKLDEFRGTFITYDMARDLGVTETDLYTLSKVDNVSIKEMTQVFNEAGCEYVGDNNFLVINSMKAYGASAILNTREFKRKVKADCYLIPSSIHEWLLLNPDMIEVADVRRIVKEVNNEKVSPEERLSYNVYYYQAETGKITIV